MEVISAADKTAELHADDYERLPKFELSVEQDEAWLTSFDVDTGIEELVEKIQSLVDQDEPASVRAGEYTVRYEFFDLIGLSYVDSDGSEFNPRRYIQDSRPSLVPLRTSIGAMREFSAMGLNPCKMVHRQPSSIMYSPEAIRASADNFRKLGIDPVQLMKKYPSAINCSIETVNERVSNLVRLGLNPVKILERSPSLIGRSSKTIRRRFNFLKSQELDVAKITHSDPKVLETSIASMRKRLDCLESKSLDVLKIINRQPSLLRTSTATLQSNLASLFELFGSNTTRLIESQPSVLSNNSQTIKEKIANIESIGLDPIVAIEKHPAILTYSISKIRNTFLMLRRAGMWAGVQDQMNNGLNLGWFAVPIEELLMFFGDEGPEAGSDRITYEHIRKAAKKKASNQKERKEYVATRVGTLEKARENRKFANNLGAVLLLKILRGK